MQGAACSWPVTTTSWKPTRSGTISSTDCSSTPPAVPCTSSETMSCAATAARAWAGRSPRRSPTPAATSSSMRHAPLFSRSPVRPDPILRNATLLVLLALFGVVPAASGVSFYFVTDVPATLGGLDYTPDQILRSDNTVYSVALSIGDSSARILALHRLPDGRWLLVPATPAVDGASGIEPRDVVLFDGVSPVFY